jgi:uncharacterized protein (TIGR03085 family)
MPSRGRWARKPANDVSLAQSERSALCDLLTKLGPDAPTLCKGWRSADLAAHLLARERRPDSTPGAVFRFRPLHTWTDRVRDGFRDTLTWDDLVDRVRTGPPAVLRPLDGAINTIEFFVHHEDLRRAQLDWRPRELGAQVETELWRRLNAMRVGPQLLSSLGHAPPVAKIEVPGQPPIMLVGRLARVPSKPTAGFRRRSVTRSPRERPEVLRGPASEVVLWLLGRRSVALVEALSARPDG